MAHLNIRVGRLSSVAVLLGLLASSVSSYALDLQPAITAFNESRYGLAKPLFEVGRKHASAKDTALYYLGRIAFNEGDMETAKDLLTQSVEIEPNSSDEYYWLGRVYGDLAQHANVFKQASYASNVHKYFQLSINANPKNIMAHRGLFTFYIMAPSIVGGGLDKAEKTLGDLRALSPVDADIKQLDLLAKQDDEAKRLAHAKFLVVTYPQTAEALFSAAHTFRNLKQLDAAIAGFEAASKLVITPQNRIFVENSTYLFSETCLWANTRIDEAISTLERFLLQKSDDKNFNKNWSYWTLAKLQRKKGNMEKYENLRRQLDPVFIKQDKLMREEVEKHDKLDKRDRLDKKVN